MFLLETKGKCTHVSTTVQQETYHESNLEQGGVEVPVSVLSSISSGKDFGTTQGSAGEMLDRPSR